VAQLPTTSFLMESQHNSAVHVLWAIQGVGTQGFSMGQCSKQPIAERINEIRNLEKSHGLVDDRLVKNG